MFSSLMKDSLVYGIANAVQKMIPFFIIPIVTGYFGQEAFKLYDVSFVYAYLFSWLIVFGQDAAAAILFFDERNRRFSREQVTAYAVMIQLVVLLLFFCFVFPFSGTWSRFLFSNEISLATWWMRALFILPGFILLNFSLNILLWQKRKGYYILLCSLLTILSLTTVFVGVIVFKGGFSTLFYCLIGSTSIIGLTGLVLVKNNVFVPILPLNTLLIKKLLWLGLPFALTAFFIQLLPSIDRFFLIQYNYSSSLAVYGLAAKLGAFMNFGISAFVLAFTPYSMAKLHEQDAEKEISDLFRVISVAAFLAIPVLLLFKDVLIHVFADSSYQSSAELLPFFFFGWVFDLFCYFSLLGIYRSQKSWLQLILFFVATGVVSVANILLIPQFGLYGAAISFCLTKGIVFFASLVWLRKYFHLKIHIASFLPALFISAICSYLVYVLTLTINILILALIAGAAIFLGMQRQKKNKNAASVF